MSDSGTDVVEAKLPRGGMTAWLVCLSAGLFFFYEFFQLNLFDVINVPLRQDFNLDATQISWMSSMYLWADILFLIPAGILLDRYSTRRLILIAMMICVIGTVGFALTQSFYMASFFHFLSGIGNAFCFLACIVLVSRWFPPRRQALVVGMLVTMAFIGGMMAHAPLAYLNAQLGWRHALIVDGGVGAMLLVWIFFVVQDFPDQIMQPVNHTTANRLMPSFLSALRNPQNWLAGIYTSCLNLPIMVLCALWGASYLQVVHHLSGMSASNVVSMIFIGSIIGCPLVGWWSDSLGRRKPLMIASAIATLLVLIPLFMGWNLSETSLGLIFFFLGLFTSAQVISYPLIAESNQAESTGAATAIASVLIMGGGGVGQVLFGLLMQHHIGAAGTQYAIADFEYAMWMFPLAIVIALVAVLMTRETYCLRKH